MTPIYLDHHAASPLAEGVHEAMEAALSEAWANPSSVHGAGQRARARMERAREAVAEALGARPADLVLTSGGTEALNLGIFGLGHRARSLLSTEAEHPAVTESLNALAAERGLPLHRLPWLGARAPTPAALSEALRELPGPTLCVLSWVDHEVGAIAPVEEHAERVRAAGGWLLVDATQAFGKLPLDLGSLPPIAGLAVAASKVGGPGGAGALVIDRDLPLRAQLHGGQQERGRRAGTPSVPLMVGFGAAALGLAARRAMMPKVAALRDRLEEALLELGGRLNGAEGPRVATVTNLSFEGLRGQALVAALDLAGVEASAGAACSSGLDRPSPTLMALYPEEPWRARSALRLSLGPSTMEAEIELTLPRIRRVLERMVKR